MSNQDYIDEVDEAEEIPSTEQLQITIPVTFRGERLDKALAACLSQYSRSKLKSWIENGLVTDINGHSVTVKEQVLGNEVLIINVPEDPQNGSHEAQNIPLEVLYSDDSIAVINKPAGMVVHPAAGNWQGTLLNAVLFAFPECSFVPRGGIVHRLDKDTSGLLVIAKNLSSQIHLVRQLQDRSVKRRYLALVWGKPPLSKLINASMGRDIKDRLKMAVHQHPHSKEAITQIKSLQTVEFEGKEITLIECKLETGRTHQIRVHLQYLGHPLVNDPIYQLKTPLQIQRKILSSYCSTEELTAKGQFLHATQLGLIHPVSGSEMFWSSVPPLPFTNLMEVIGIKASSWQHLTH